MIFSHQKSQMPNPDQALPGRAQSMPIPSQHFVLNSPLEVPPETAYQFALFGMGCFWGAEKAFWSLPGVYSTAVGYAAGYTANPTYQEVCSGRTGHNEVVRVVFDAARLEYSQLLKIFWEGHDPTQGMRQGNDKGTQYRSGIYTYTPAQQQLALASKRYYAQQLLSHGRGEISTEILSATVFYFAEADHQQYLAKNPGGYCGLGGTDTQFELGNDEQLRELLGR